MIYQRILPHPALQVFVKEYMLFHHIFDPALPPVVKVLPPLPEHGIEFLPSGLATAINQQTGESMRETPSVIFGQPVSRINFIMPLDEYFVIRVIFSRVVYIVY